MSLAYKMNLESGPSDLMVSKLDKTYLWSIHKWEEEGEGDERKNQSVCFFPTCDLDSKSKPEVLVYQRVATNHGRR